MKPMSDLTADPGDAEEVAPTPTTGAAASSGVSVNEETMKFFNWVSTQLGQAESFGARVNERIPWCPEWWKHPEVVARLTAVWDAYLASLTLAEGGDGLAVSNWWLQHWDTHAAVLFNPSTGPFRSCDQHGHHSQTAPTRLDLTMPPADWVL